MRQQNGEGIRLALLHEFAHRKAVTRSLLPARSSTALPEPAQAEELNRIAANIGHGRLIQQQGHPRGFDAPLEFRAIVEQIMIAFNHP